MIIVAGHICLDVIPTFPDEGRPLGDMLAPGMLTNVGNALLSTGGAVSNTGLALFKLGIPVRLLGKVGDDLFGSAVRDIVAGYDEGLRDGLIVGEGETTSYTIVINPPGVDRIFLHCPGANDTFSAVDVSPRVLEGGSIFHFGYPPLMRRMFLNGGEELAAVMKAARTAGCLTSLDMAYVDPNAEAGRVDWHEILERVLPEVDLFFPSLGEVQFMLRQPRAEPQKIDDVRGTAETLLALGCRMVALKLGDRGLYFRSGNQRPGDLSEEWASREMYVPCFKANVAGTTGAGDSTVAGFLAGLWRDMTPEACMQRAVAVGACNVERADALSGIPSWDELTKRLEEGWDLSGKTLSRDPG